MKLESVEFEACVEHACVSVGVGDDVLPPVCSRKILYLIFVGLTNHENST